MEICSYFPVQIGNLIAVGWLDASTLFATGSTPRNVFERLEEFVKSPWQPFVSSGYHECNLCQFTGEQRGIKNLFIPNQGRIYVCPELITHYINAHFYRPPQEFCDAVLACPPMNSMEYKKLLVACRGQALWQSGDEQL